MFVGHYSASLAAKAIDPRLPLGWLFIAAQLVDIAWAVFVPLGIEELELTPGFTASNDFDLVYVVYTHSLAATIGWALAALIAWSVARNRGVAQGSALLVAAVVLSHWFLDLLVHTPDLPLYGEHHKQGLGLWNYPVVTLVLEGGLLAATGAWYLRATRTLRRGGALGVVLLLVCMMAIQVASVYGPRPQSEIETVAGAFLCYLGFAAAAAYFDRRRG